MLTRNELSLISSPQGESDLVADYIRNQATYCNGRPLRILEAGCGQYWEVDLQGLNYVLTGIDIDAAALDIRKFKKGDLHEAVVGDLRTADLSVDYYDVIYNAFVLEHVDGAVAVLDNFFKWLRPGGVVVLKIPDPNSVQGLVARVTPHWFLVFYYRHFLGRRQAGRPGHAPYKIYYDDVVSREGIREYCRSRHVEMVAEYGDGYIRPGTPLMRKPIQAAKTLISAFSFGTFSSRHTNLLYVLQKASTSPRLTG